MEFVITISDDYVPPDPVGVIYAVRDALEIANIPANIEEIMKPMKGQAIGVSRIVVVVEGGLVRNFISDAPIEVFVRDIDKGSEEEIVNTHWGPNEIVVDPKEVDKIVAEFNKEEDKEIGIKKGDLVVVKETGDKKTVKSDYGPNFSPRYLLRGDDRLYFAEELEIVKSKKAGKQAEVI